jgi:hypothetical protein
MGHIAKGVINNAFLPLLHTNNQRRHGVAKYCMWSQCADLVTMCRPSHIKALALFTLVFQMSSHSSRLCCAVQVLEELAITAQQQLLSKLPFCAFNGGNDVFVDVGNKSLGLDALMRHLGCYPHEVLHVSHQQQERYA